MGLIDCRLLSKCCEFSRLEQDATSVMTVTVRPGEQYHGGEVYDKGQMIGFNVVKDIRQFGTLGKGLVPT
jgi:hypothetical protein